LRAKHGPKKAIAAVAASMLIAIYRMLKDGTFYTDLGPDHFEHRSKTAQTTKLVARLKELGFEVQITPIAASTPM
jgi:transposase